jgi:hypothetical protein
MPGSSAGIEPGSRSSDRIELATAELRLVVAPALGGRIVSLEDRASGREWLVADPALDGIGPDLAWAGEDAIFSGERAFGWDECLPTVAPCPDPLDLTGRPLRDHGDGWGRPVDVEWPAAITGAGATPGPASGTPAGPESLRLTWQVAGRYRFERLVRLDGPTVRTDYRLTALGRDFPFLWSMHPLLALEPGATLVIAGLQRVTVTAATGVDLVASGQAAGWPVAELRSGGSVDLSRIPDAEAGVALKAYATTDAIQGPVIAVQPDGAGLAFDWDRRVAPVLGIWIDAGGWPAGEGRQQVALEPTTAPFDDLAGAFAADRATWARAGRDVRWWTTIRLVSADPGRSPR